MHLSFPMMPAEENTSYENIFSPPHSNYTSKEKRMTEYIHFFLFFTMYLILVRPQFHVWVAKSLPAIVKKSVQLRFSTWMLSYYQKSDTSETRFIIFLPSDKLKSKSNSNFLASVNGTSLLVNPAGKLTPRMNDIIHKRNRDKIFYPHKC